jgi:pyrroline-5-carboxylate reductase
MSGQSIGFIGGGRITRIFLSGWSRASAMPSKVVVSDTDARVLSSLKDKFTTIEAAASDNRAAAAQDVVFVALHPPAIPDALSAVKSALKAEAIVVSLAPKLTMAKLLVMLGGFARLTRVIPNAPSIVGAGFNPLAFSESLASADRDVVKELLRPLGSCCETSEEKLEAYAVLTGMGPTYFWPILYELVGLGESFGLTRSEAESGMECMLAGAMATMRGAGLDAKAVQDLIPVKPLADLEPTILDAYRTKLKAVFEKIKP